MSKHYTVTLPSDRYLYFLFLVVNTYQVFYIPGIHHFLVYNA